MEERNVLSPEEVDAIIKAAQSTESADISVEEQTESTSNINISAFNNIIENTAAEIETKLTVLLRKKITVKSNVSSPVVMEEIIKQSNETEIYTSMNVGPYDSNIIIVSENLFIDNAINLLYGGKLQPSDSPTVSLGKVGMITAEKIHEMLMACFVEMNKDKGLITLGGYKTSNKISNVNEIDKEEEVYSATFTISIEEIESKVHAYFTEEFLIKLLPVKTGKGKHKEKDFWRTAIKSEVVDSYVTITTTIGDIPIKLKDFMELKEGDEIPINDPTLVYICLNNLKLYKGLAGQSNSKMVAKIVSQI